MRQIDTSRETLYLGYRGESLAAEAVFSVYDWLQEYGTGGVFLLVVRRPGEDVSYRATITTDEDEGTVTWVLTDIDTALMGVGRAQLEYYVGTVLVKAASWRTLISEAVVDNDAETWAETVDETARAIAAQLSLSAQEIEAIKDDAEAAAAAAEESETYARTFTGAPLVAATAAAMEDEDRIYVYTGSEDGYTAGNWYYYDGSAWVSGGVYNSTAFETDATLSISGAAADAAVVGSEVADLQSEINEISDISYTPVTPPNLYDGGSMSISDATQQQDIVFDTPLVNSLKIEFDCTATDVTSINVQIRSASHAILEQKSVDVSTGVRSSVEFDKYDAGVKTIRLKLKTIHETTAALTMSNISVTQTDLPPTETRTANDATARANAQTAINNIASSVILQGETQAVNTSNYTTTLPDLNGANLNRVYRIHGCLQSISNRPDTTDTSATLITYCNDTYSNKSWYIQILVTNNNDLYFRSCWGGTWKAWKIAATISDIPYVYNQAQLENKYFVSTCVDKTKTHMTAGEKIVSFGDSIMAGPSGTPWISMFCDVVGTTVENMGVSGALFGHSTRTEDKWISTQLAAATSGNKWADADYVIVAAGTNDAGYDTPIAEVAQYVQAAIDYIKEQTDAHIIFITPIRRGNTENSTKNMKLPQISGVIENIALQEGCSVINGFDFPIPTYDIDDVIDNLTDSNGLHPDSVGRAVYARSVINALF